jgi:hypothetical protein
MISPRLQFVLLASFLSVVIFTQLQVIHQSILSANQQMMDKLEMWHSDESFRSPVLLDPENHETLRIVQVL